MHENVTVWQMGAGPQERSYSDVFFNNSVGLIGSGDAGRWEPSKPDSVFLGRFARVFATEVKKGDIIVLRLGINTIVAVGIVASDKYLYLEQFDDVNGWDLQHARRIRWNKLKNSHTFTRKVFGANPSRLSRVWDEEVKRIAHRFINSPPTDWQKDPLPDLPPIEEKMRKPPDVAQKLIDKARYLVWNWEQFGDFPSEAEIVCHFVVPLLEALGWRSELIAVQWKKTDVAIFKQLPRTPENCLFIIEAKRFGTGFGHALNQAKYYVDKIGAKCKFIVTDGIRYRIYDPDNLGKRLAYANLERLKVSAKEFFNLIKANGKQDK